MAENDLIEVKRNLSHIVISAEAEGPELTIGDTVLKFKAKVPVGTFARYTRAQLDENSDTVTAIIQYIESLLVSPKEDFYSILDNIEIDGLGEILSALNEIYTGFQPKS